LNGIGKRVRAFFPSRVVTTIACERTPRHAHIHIYTHTRVHICARSTVFAAEARYLGNRDFITPRRHHAFRGLLNFYNVEC